MSTDTLPSVSVTDSGEMKQVVDHPAPVADVVLEVGSSKKKISLTLE